MNAVVSTPPSEKTLRLYKYPAGSGNYVLGSLYNDQGKPKFPDLNGRIIQFINGKYATNDVRIIEELDAEVARGNENIVIDEREREVPENFRDPLHRIREQIRAEEIARINVSLDPTRDMGVSSQRALTPANTTTIADTSAGHGPAGVAKAMLATLKG